MAKTAGELLAEALNSKQPIDKEKLGAKMADAMQREAPKGIKVSHVKIS